jgi:hypothetical protein
MNDGSLGWYIADSTSLLRDSLSIFTPQGQLVRWINQGRRQIARRTGCIRLLITGQSSFGNSSQPGFFVPGGAIPGNLPDAADGSGSTNLFMTIPNQEMYPFKGFINDFLRAQYEGADMVSDIIEPAISWGGSFRPVQNWLPFEQYQAWVRVYQILSSAFPSVWTTNGDGENQQFWVYPPPVEALEMELDVFAIPKNLYSDDDYDLLPESFRQAVKFYASGMAFLNTRPAQASIMFNQFADTIGVARFAADMGKMSSYYDWL